MLCGCLNSATHSSVDKRNDATRTSSSESYPAASSAVSPTSRAPVTKATAPPSTAGVAAAVPDDSGRTWTPWQRCSWQRRCGCRRWRPATVSQRTLYLSRASQIAQGEGTTAAPARSHHLQGMNLLFTVSAFGTKLFLNFYWVHFNFSVNRALCSLYLFGIKVYRIEVLNNVHLLPVANGEIFKRRGGAEDNVSAPSSFIANAHNKLYAVYTGKGDLF